METLTFNTHMLVSGIILAVTFIAIFTEQLHGFERSKVARGGCGGHDRRRADLRLLLPDAGH